MEAGLRWRMKVHVACVIVADVVVVIVKSIVQDAANGLHPGICRLLGVLSPIAENLDLPPG
jgi:hypothetical protein